MSNWYYIGPDKTGLACSSCCAGFNSLGGSCAPFACSTDGYPRSYVCPNPHPPTPDHVYEWLGGPNDDVTIGTNPVKCGSNTNCYSYTGGPLNSAGRIGQGCSQEYVTSEYLCNNVVDPCDEIADCGPCAVPVAQAGITFYSCYKSTTSCSCYSCSVPQEKVCGCQTTVCLCPEECPSGGECCSTECIVPYICPDGSEVYYNRCGGTPICPCEGLTPPECEECESPVCTGESYQCQARTCSSYNTCTRPPWTAPCTSGFTCSCGNCVCNAASTCCVDLSAGWSYSAAESRCIPCYEPIGGIPWTKSDCCDSAWKRKRCATGKVCCSDGRCYDEDTVLCSYPN